MLHFQLMDHAFSTSKFKWVDSTAPNSQTQSRQQADTVNNSSVEVHSHKILFTFTLNNQHHRYFPRRRESLTPCVPVR